MDNLKDKKILLCVTGSIAAFKACEFIRLLRKQGCGVKVVMSNSAQDFIGKLSLAALSDNEVLTESNQSGLEHVKFAIEFDAVVILPATANILCKAGSGIADDIISTVLSICEQPKLFAPAMNFRMWQSEATQQAVEKLKDQNCIIMQPEDGALASLHKGEGRLPDLHEVINELRQILHIKTPLKNKKILISAGPTRENIDPVRFISNRSSGKMGYAIAEEARNMGANVQLVSGPVSLENPSEVNVIHVETGQQMHDEMSKHLDSDIIIMCAAVSDYKVENIANEKIKSTKSSISLDLYPTTDIIKSLAKNTQATIVAFALETSNGKKNAIKKLKDKGADVIVLNHPSEDGCGIDSNFNKVSILSRDNNSYEISKNRKDRVAKQILKFVINMQD
tara:strand:+ start:1479 stop:2660 length:1182 start_codon:yes stop_codon:yes gene_type:complete